MSAATGLKILILFEYLKDLQKSGAWFCSTVLKWIASLKPSILGPVQEPERSPISERRWAVVVVARFGVLNRITRRVRWRWSCEFRPLQPGIVCDDGINSGSVVESQFNDGVTREKD